MAEKIRELEQENARLRSYQEKNEALNQQKVEFQTFLQQQLVDRESNEQAERMLQIQSENGK